MSALIVLARLFYPMNAIRVVRRGPGRGLRYAVSPGMGVTYAWGHRAYRFDWFARTIPTGKTVLDIGANFGQNSLVFSRLVGPDGCVHAFEPVPEVCDVLRANVSRNGIRNVAIVEAAAADTTGTASMHYDPSMPTCGKLDHVEAKYPATGDALEVRSVRLDDYCHRLGIVPAFIKVDVEGAGASVLRGAQSLLRSHHPSIYMELHGPDEQAAARGLVTEFGYTARSLDGAVVDDPAGAWHSPLWFSRG